MNNLLNPGKRTDTGGEEDVVDVNTGHESDALRTSTIAVGKLLRNIGRSHEHGTSDDVAAHQRDSPTNFVQEQDASNLSDNSHRVVDTVDQEGAVREADRLVDLSGIVLDC